MAAALRVGRLGGVPIRGAGFCVVLDPEGIEEGGRILAPKLLPHERTQQPTLQIKYTEVPSLRRAPFGAASAECTRARKNSEVPRYPVYPVPLFFVSLISEDRSTPNK